MQRAALKTVKVKTAAVTTEPGSHWPKRGANQLYCIRKVPAKQTTSEQGEVSSEVLADTCKFTIFGIRLQVAFVVVPYGDLAKGVPTKSTLA